MEGLSELEPRPVDFQKIHPKQLRSIPKTKGVYYWVDAWGKVWGSTIDAPQITSTENGDLEFTEIKGAKSYNVYELRGYNDKESLAGSIINSNSKKKMIANTIDTKFKANEANSLIEVGTTYLVSAVDRHGLETAPVGTSYLSYESPIESERNPILSTHSFAAEDFMSFPATVEMAQHTMSQSEKTLLEEINGANDANFLTVSQSNSIIYAVGTIEGSVPVYKYQKYTVSTSSSYSLNGWRLLGYQTVPYQQGGKSSYSFNSNNGIFTLGSTFYSISGYGNNCGTTYDLETSNHSYITRYVGNCKSGDAFGYHVYENSSKRVVEERKNNLVDTVYSSEAYPVDGKHTDGYWYQRTTQYPNYVVHKFNEDKELMGIFNPMTKEFVSNKINFSKSLEKLKVLTEIDSSTGINYEFHIKSDGDWIKVSKDDLNGINDIDLTSSANFVYWKIKFLGNTNSTPNISKVILSK